MKNSGRPRRPEKPWPTLKKLNFVTLYLRNCVFWKSQFVISQLTQSILQSWLRSIRLVGFFKTTKVPESDAEKSNVMVDDIIACINGIELRNESIHECANLMATSKEYVDFKLKRVAQNKEWIGLSLADFISDSFWLVDWSIADGPSVQIQLNAPIQNL